jgi:ACS family hexuronate transporter-like MFS transporter
MPAFTPDSIVWTRSRSWKWWICGLLLLATMVNYMDRLTLNLMALPIMDEFGLRAREYGYLESVFGVAFALGSILMGVLADRWNVRWIYLAAVLLWSLAGFLTGLAGTFATLLLCRFCLGLAESGNWPCALRTTQRILPPSERPMGNSLLQSGAALGSVLTPLIVTPLFLYSGSWRYACMVVGALGLIWAAGWIVSLRSQDLALDHGKQSHFLVTLLAFLVLLYGIDLAIHLRFAATPAIPLAAKFVVTAVGVVGVAVWLGVVTRDDPELVRSVFFRRFAVLAVLVVAINLTWHFFRAWLPLFLQNHHGYSLNEFSQFSIAYYIATDAGCLTAGFVTLRLSRRGLPIHTSRVLVFTVCALATTLSLAAAVLPRGWLLLAVLLVIGFACLGLLPNYYSFSQELTIRHQGKLTGALSCICWMFMSLLQEVVGDVVQRTGSYTEGVACAGLPPLFAVVVLLLFWGKSSPAEPHVSVEESTRRKHSEGITLPPPSVDASRT